MCLVAEAPVIGIGAEARVYAIVVGGGIAVIGGEAAVVVGGVVFEDGSESKRRDAEFTEIVEVLTDAFQVAAVAQ